MHSGTGSGSQTPRAQTGSKQNAQQNAPQKKSQSDPPPKLKQTNNAQKPRALTSIDLKDAPPEGPSHINAKILAAKLTALEEDNSVQGSELLVGGTGHREDDSADGHSDGRYAPEQVRRRRANSKKMLFLWSLAIYIVKKLFKLFKK